MHAPLPNSSSIATAPALQYARYKLNLGQNFQETQIVATQVWNIV